MQRVLLLVIIAICIAARSVANALLCRQEEVSYTPSMHEIASGSTRWQDYCSHYAKEENVRQSILKSVRQAVSLKDNRIPPVLTTNMNVSYFKIKYNCFNKTVSTFRSIEPLYSLMRHPDAVRCSHRKARVSNLKYSTDYLITDDASRFRTSTAHQNMYFDLGASTYDGISQKWMLLHYEERGIRFHRHLLWEARPINHQQLFKDIPTRFHNAYQIFNTPASLDSDRNPLNILKEIADEHDFVVVKLDIDNSNMERAYINQILQDSKLASLIDELFWEPHFNFRPLVECCWKDTADLHLTVSDVHRIFTKLRQLGIRAHGWP